MPRHPLQSAARRGASAVEFAVVLPVIVLLLLGAVEVGRAVLVQHTLQEAAQAGARLYSVGDTDVDDADNMIAVAMANAGIAKYSIQYDPPSKDQIDENMEPVTATVSVKFSDVAWLSPDFFAGATIVGRCTMPADMEEER